MVWLCWWIIMVWGMVTDGWSIMDMMVMVGHSTMAVVLVLLILLTAMTITITMLEVVMAIHHKTPW